MSRTKARAKPTATKRSRPPSRSKSKKTAARRASGRKTSKPVDLNTLTPKGVRRPRKGTPRSRTAVSAQTRVHFGDLTEPLAAFLEEADSIVGCVAWITSKPILEVLSTRPGRAALCVQKEQILRGGQGGTWGVELRRRYRSLPPGPLRRGLPPPLGTTNGPSRIQPVRCVGVAGAGMHSPRMHHKFFVAGHRQGRRWVAQRVWTGSFNASHNAASSIENAVVIDDPTIAAAYLDEFARVYAISEPLSWTSRNPRPELTQRKL